MKKNSHIVLTALIVLFCHGFAFGAEEPSIGAEESYMDRLMMSEPNPKNRLVSGLTGGRLSLNASYKMWVAKWQSFSFVNNPGVATVPSQFTSDTKLFSGPSVTAAYRFRDSEWFHSAGMNFTYLTASDWDFSGSEFGGSSITAKRRDLSFTGSLAIWRGIGVFGGYYNSKQKLNIFNVKFFGPLIGMYGSGALNKWFGIYGNLAVAFLDYKFVGGSTISKDTIGYSTEWGFNLNGPDIWKVGTGLQIGYRAQVITVNEGGNLTTNDVTWGPIFSIVAKF